jgi:hypothetical protein
MILRSDECIAHALENERLAITAKTPEIREALQTLAQGWGKLARDFQMQEAATKAPPGYQQSR